MFTIIGHVVGAFIVTIGLSMSVRKIFVVLSFLLSCLGPANVTSASEAHAEVRVQMNMARILRLPSPASTVVIGNPDVADATIQDAETLVITGKGFGSTNLIALDAVGNPIADLIIHVSAEHQNKIIVFQGLDEQAVSCAPSCLPMTIGDNK